MIIAGTWDDDVTVDNAVVPKETITSGTTANEVAVGHKNS